MKESKIKIDLKWQFSWHHVTKFLKVNFGPRDMCYISYKSLLKYMFIRIEKVNVCPLRKKTVLHPLFLCPWFFRGTSPKTFILAVLFFPTYIFLSLPIYSHDKSTTRICSYILTFAPFLYAFF